MRRGEGLVQIIMHHVEAEIAGTRDAGERVHVGAVAVDEPAASVHQPDDLFDVLLEQAERVRIGHHDAGDGVVAGATHGFQIDVAAGVGGQLDGREARHGGRGRIGAMGGVGNENARPLWIAAITMIGTHHQQSGEFAMRTGGWLQRHARKAADLCEPLLKFEHEREIALNRVRVLQRMRLGESGEPRDLLVDLWIELHGAGAERIEAGIHAEIALRQREIVPHDVDLRQLGQFAIAAQLGRGQLRAGHVGCGQIDTMPAGHAQLIDGWNLVAGHDATSPSADTSRSMPARVLTSVTATSIWFFRCG